MRLLSEKDLTFESACNLAKNMEIASENVELMQPNENLVGALVKSRLGPKVNYYNGRDTKRDRFANVQCYQRLEFGHTVRFCPKTQRNQRARGAKRYNSQRPNRNKLNEVRHEEISEESIQSDEEENGIGFINNVIESGPELLSVSINNILI